MNYTGLGVVRKFNDATDMVTEPAMFDTPKSQWVIAELWWVSGFDILVFSSVAAAEKRAKELGIEFHSRVKVKPKAEVTP